MSSRDIHDESRISNDVPTKPTSLGELKSQLGFTDDYTNCLARKPYSKSPLKDCEVEVPPYKRSRIGNILIQLCELEYSSPNAGNLLSELSEVAICNGHHGSNFKLDGRLYKTPIQFILEGLQSKWHSEPQLATSGCDENEFDAEDSDASWSNIMTAAACSSDDPFIDIDASTSKSDRQGTTKTDRKASEQSPNIQNDSHARNPTPATAQQSISHDPPPAAEDLNDSPLDHPSPNESILSSKPSEMFDNQPVTRETTPSSEISEEDSYISSGEIGSPSPAQASRYATYKTARAAQRRVCSEEQSKVPSLRALYQEIAWNGGNNGSTRTSEDWQKEDLDKSIKGTVQRCGILRRHHSFDNISIMDRSDMSPSEVRGYADVEQNELRASQRMKDHLRKENAKAICSITNHSSEKPPSYNKTMAFGPWPEKNDGPCVHKLMDRMRQHLVGRTHSAGYVYGFTDTDNPGFIKIGYAMAQAETPDPNSTAAEVTKRLKDWSDECNYDMDCKFQVYMPSAVLTIEALIHISLHRFRRKVTKCKTIKCLKKHREWFQLDVDTARGMTQLWAAFSHRRPYNDAGMLRKFWQIKTWDERTRKALKDVHLELWVYQYLEEAIEVETKQEEEFRRMERQRLLSEEKERIARKKVAGKDASIKMMKSRVTTFEF